MDEQHGRSKGLRWSLLKNPWNLAQCRNASRRCNRITGRASALKETFAGILRGQPDVVTDILKRMAELGESESASVDSSRSPAPSRHLNDIVRVASDGASASWNTPRFDHPQSLAASIPHPRSSADRSELHQHPAVTAAGPVGKVIPARVRGVLRVGRASRVDGRKVCQVRPDDAGGVNRLRRTRWPTCVSSRTERGYTCAERASRIEDSRRQRGSIR